MIEEQALNHLQRYLVEEAVEDFQHGQLSRRQALKMIAGVLGSLVAADSLLAACTPAAATVPAQAATAPSSPTGAPPPSVAAVAPPATLPVEASPTAAETPTLAPAAGAAQVTAIATLAVLTTTATATTHPVPTVPPGVRVSPDDPAIAASDVQVPGQGATLIGYLARPKGDGRFPPVLVCHENRGLTDYIKDVTRRVARAGYAGLAIDLLSRQGGTASIADPTQIPGLLGNTPPSQFVQDFQSGLSYLEGLSYVVKDRPGMVGFCFGGGVTWLCATGIPALRAAVPFYGPNPPLADVPKIQAAVLAFYGALDQRIDAGIPAIEQAMTQSHKVFEKVVEPDANHAFHNDTGPNYNPQAAQDAWTKTLAWFEKYLKS